MECQNLAVEGDAVGEKLQEETDVQRQFERAITLSGSSHGSSTRVEGRTRILRASDVLLSLAGRSTSDVSERSACVANFKEALRLFPPFRDDDGFTLGAKEVNCPDCDAIFSSPDELGQHYLTRFCPGAAVAVYVMTRDRLITKGYRMEKRLMPLNCQPIRFFCGKCEKQFDMGADEKVDRQKNSRILAGCKHCGEKCNIAYDPILNDPRDDITYRDVQPEIAPDIQPSPILAQKNFSGAKFPMTAGNGGEQYFTKRAKRIRDSWSFRKVSQGEEDELIAISFAGLCDLERVHAPNGIYQPFEGSTELPNDQSTTSITLSAPAGTAVVQPKSTATLCEEENEHRTGSVDSEGNLLDGSEASRDPSIWTRRHSFFQKFFGRKIPRGLSRAKSASSRGKKLIKRVNTVRFSLAAKSQRNSNGSVTPSSEGRSEYGGNTDLRKSRQDINATIPEAEYVALLRNSQNIFIHMEYLSGGALIHDASGRQRILQMDEIAQLFLQLKDQFCSATIWSKALSTRLRAEAALTKGNLKAAVVEYMLALDMLKDCPALDIDKLSRAAMLYSLGQAYHSLEMIGDAEGCYLESLGLYKRALGRDFSKNFAILSDLGALCEKKGFSTEAAALYERSFAGRLKTLGRNAPETLTSMQDLASVKLLLGDYPSALLLLEKVVPSLETVFGIQNETTLDAMNKLSVVYHKLKLGKESRSICVKTIPHCKVVFGIDSPITRETVLRYLIYCDNFDFPFDIKDILDQYQRSRDPDALRVIHRLGRSYMDAGLNRDAADVFETLVEEFLTIKGPEAPETFDALSALCVCCEHLDSVDKAILAYQQLVQMACQTPEGHHSRKRIRYAGNRIAELEHRQQSLATEKKAWGIQNPGQCGQCGSSTTVLCNTCKIHRFCSEKCHKAGLESHMSSCVPSVSLRESKSLAVRSRCAPTISELALSKVEIPIGKKIIVKRRYTFYLDPRNFTTFRMMLSPKVNTVVLFSLDSDVQYATADSTIVNADGSVQNNGVSSGSNSNQLNWMKPEQQDHICYTPSEEQSQSKYVLVAPGKELHQSLVDKRIAVRGGGGERERFNNLAMPNRELIEYAQGLLLTGYLGETFMHVIEWVWN